MVLFIRYSEEGQTSVFGQSKSTILREKYRQRMSLKTATHRTDSKELDERWLFLGRKAVLERTVKTSANGQLARTVCSLAFITFISLLVHCFTKMNSQSE